MKQDFEGFGAVIDTEPNEQLDIIIRQSTASSMEKCPASVAAREDPEYIPTFGEPLVFGSSTHALVEQAINGAPMLAVIAEDNIAETVVDIIENDYDQRATEWPYFDMVDELRIAVIAWEGAFRHLFMDAGVTEHETEKTLYAPLGVMDGRNVWVRGTLDLILKRASSVNMVDWKTAGRGWNQTMADGSRQASIYSVLGEANGYGFAHKWLFGVYNRQKAEWESWPTSRDKRQGEAVKREMWMYAKMIETGAMPCQPMQEMWFKRERAWYARSRFCGAWNTDACLSKHIDGSMEVAKLEW